METIGESALTVAHHWIAEDIRTRASDLRAKFIVTDEARAARVLEAVTDLDFVQEVFVIGKAAGCTSIDKLFEDDGKGTLDLHLEYLSYLVLIVSWCLLTSDPFARLSRTIGRWFGFVGMADVLEWYHWNAKRHRSHSSWYDNAAWIQKVGSPPINSMASKLKIILSKHFEFARTHPILNHKMLFLNHMINSGGMALCLLLTLAHCDIAVISSCEDYNLLEAIEKVKVRGMRTFIAHNIRNDSNDISISSAAVQYQRFSESHCYNLPPSEFGSVRPDKRSYGAYWRLLALPKIWTGNIW